MLKEDGKRSDELQNEDGERIVFGTIGGRGKGRERPLEEGGSIHGDGKLKRGRNREKTGSALHSGKLGERGKGRERPLEEGGSIFDLELV